MKACCFTKTKTATGTAEDEVVIYSFSPILNAGGGKKNTFPLQFRANDRKGDGGLYVYRMKKQVFLIPPVISWQMASKGKLYLYQMLDRVPAEEICS